MIDSIVLFWRLRKQSPWSQADPAFSLLNEKVDRTGLVCKINSRPTYLPTAIPCFLQPYHRKWLAWTDRWAEQGEPEWTRSHSTSDRKVPGAHTGLLGSWETFPIVQTLRIQKLVSSAQCHTRVSCASAQPLVSESHRAVALPDLRVRSWECPTAKKLVLFCTDSQVHAIEIFYCTCLIDCHHSSQQGACYLFYFLVWKVYGKVMCRGPHMKFTGQLADSFFITWALGVELRSSGLARNLTTCWAASPASGGSHTQHF